MATPVTTDINEIQSGILCLFGYNNYFNRVHRKSFGTTEALLDHLDSLYDEGDDEVYWDEFDAVNNINFSYNDGINAEIILGREQLTVNSDNSSDDQDLLDWTGGAFPDYLIVYKRLTRANNTSYNSIASRWFVLNCVETRLGQYKLTLKRDTISDFVDVDAEFDENGNVINNQSILPAFIKKGYVNDSNPLILNSENVSVNQIKKEEILLQDNSKTPWIVGYMAKDTGVDSTVTVQIPPEDFSDYTTIEDIASDLGISSTDLMSVLKPQDESSPSYFLDTNVEVVGWLNHPDNTDLEWKLRAGSYNNLTSFTRAFDPTMVSHNPVSDCFAKISVNYRPDASPWKDALQDSLAGIKSSWETITGHPLLVKNVYNTLHQMSKQNGKKIVLFNSTYYYIVEKDTVSQGGNKYEVSKQGTIFETVCSSFITKQNTMNPYANVTALTGGKIFVYANEIQSVFYLERITDTSVIPGAELTISSTRYGLVNEPFDMFAMPYRSIKVTDENGNQYDLQGDYSQKLAMQMVKQLNGSETPVIYDVQLLPYCPIQDNNTETILKDNELDLSTLKEGYDYDWITEDSVSLTRRITGSPLMPMPIPSPGVISSQVMEVVSIDNSSITNITYEVISGEILSGEPLVITHSAGLLSGTTIRTSAFTFDYDGTEASIPVIQFTITFTQNDYPTNIILYPKNNSNSFTINKKLSLKDGVKIENICNNYRLCSPNYQGSFDFNVAKNDGQVEGFTVDFTYKPYTPYIRVAPLFAGMYGGDYDDCRGLICGGDFSIGFYTHKWQDYQIQNKNYQNIFNREIQNLDVSQEIQREKMLYRDISAIPGAGIAGGVGGAKAGAKAGPYGAIGGAIAGAATGLGGGIANLALDNYWTNKQLVEQRQYAIDKYNLQLGNIQALPYTLTKVGAFNVNSKLYPFIEYYTCTDEEKEVLENKFHYEGYSLGIVGNLLDYVDFVNGSYIQADLIRNKAMYKEFSASLNTYTYHTEEYTTNEAIVNDIYNEFSKGVFIYGKDDMDRYLIHKGE